MTVKEIITEYLRARGFDGLCNPENECGCGIGGLILCDGSCDTCKPAYRHIMPPGHEYDVIYSTDKEYVEGEE